MPDSALTFLLSSGAGLPGWGYQRDHDPVVEPTAAVLIYLQRFQEAQDTLHLSLDWLVQIQHPDGGWGINESDPESGWHTAWAILALRRCLGPEAVIASGIDWLGQVDAMKLQDSADLAMGEQVAKIDFSLVGWPWLPGEASWVEPTALSILASDGRGQTSKEQNRLAEAVKYLVDRRCKGGGWNVGNPVMFNSNLPARAVPTAWSLIALHHIAPQHIEVNDVSALKKEIAQDGGVYAAAWGLLALRILGEDDAETESHLLNIQAENGSWQESPYLTAIAAMALKGEF